MGKWKVQNLVLIEQKDSKTQPYLAGVHLFPIELKFKTAVFCQ